MKRNIIVGLFVLAGVVLFTVGLYLIGSRNDAFNAHDEFYTDFANLGGLADGDRVEVGGLEVGQVLDIGIPSSPASRFRVKFRVEKKVGGLVRTDSVASVETEGVVGNIYLSVKPGSAEAPEAGNQATLPSKEPFELSAMIEKGNGLIADADRTINDADTTIKGLGGKLNGTMDGVTATVANVNDVVVGIKHGRGTVGLLLRNQQLAAQVQGAVADAKQATGNLAHASSAADQMISDLQAHKLPQQVDDTMKSVKDAAAQIDASSGQIHRVLTDATRPDENGVSAGGNIRDSLSNLNSATANMSEDTEALKHEFFFRGLFRNRGYYDLSDMAPDAYRQNKVFASGANLRFWLSAADLFETRPDGTEELSLRGKEALDDAATVNNGSAIGSPMVIEGYSDASGPATEVQLSRRRALLASHYLETHFELDPKNVGFVALESTPPPGVGKPVWNGVCVVLLKGKALKK